MSDFESFLEGQLNEYGVIDSLKSSAAHKYGAGGKKLLAKVGSKTAQGELALRDEIKELTDGFKYYCGEQQVNMKTELRAEDCVDFLIHRLQFQIADPIQFLYKQPKDEQVWAIVTGIEAEVEAEADETPKFDELVQAVQGGDATARYGMWYLYREHKAVRNLCKASNLMTLVGKSLDKANLNKMLTGVAKIRLKRRATSGRDGGMGSIATDPQGRPNFDVKHGNVAAVDTDPAKGWSQDAFGATGIFAHSGMGNITQLARMLAQATVDNDADVTDRKSNEFMNMGEKQCANLSRLLLEYFVPRFMRAKLEPCFANFSEKDAKGNPMRSTLRDTVDKILTTMSAKEYNADAVHQMIMREFPNQTYGKFVTALLICLSDAYDGSLNSSGPEA